MTGTTTTTINMKKLDVREVRPSSPTLQNYQHVIFKATHLLFLLLVFLIPHHANASPYVPPNADKSDPLFVTNFKTPSVTWLDPGDRTAIGIPDFGGTNTSVMPVWNGYLAFPTWGMDRGTAGTRPAGDTTLSQAPLAGTFALPWGPWTPGVFDIAHMSRWSGILGSTLDATLPDRCTMLHYFEPENGIPTLMLVGTLSYCPNVTRSNIPWGNGGNPALACYPYVGSSATFYPGIPVGAALLSHDGGTSWTLAAVDPRLARCNFAVTTINTGLKDLQNSTAAACISGGALMRQSTLDYADRTSASTSVACSYDGYYWWDAADLPRESSYMSLTSLNETVIAYGLEVDRAANLDFPGNNSYLWASISDMNATCVIAESVATALSNAAAVAQASKSSPWMWSGASILNRTRCVNITDWISLGTSPWISADEPVSTSARATPVLNFMPFGLQSPDNDGYSPPTILYGAGISWSSIYVQPTRNLWMLATEEIYTILTVVRALAPSSGINISTILPLLSNASSNCGTNYMIDLYSKWAFLPFAAPISSLSAYPHIIRLYGDLTSADALFIPDGADEEFSLKSFYLFALTPSGVSIGGGLIIGNTGFNWVTASNTDLTSKNGMYPWTNTYGINSPIPPAVPDSFGKFGFNTMTLGFDPKAPRRVPVIYYMAYNRIIAGYTASCFFTKCNQGSSYPLPCQHTPWDSACANCSTCFDSNTTSSGRSSSNGRFRALQTEMASLETESYDNGSNNDGEASTPSSSSSSSSHSSLKTRQVAFGAMLQQQQASQRIRTQYSSVQCSYVFISITRVAAVQDTVCNNCSDCSVRNLVTSQACTAVDDTICILPPPEINPSASVEDWLLARDPVVAQVYIGSALTVLAMIGLGVVVLQGWLEARKQVVIEKSRQSWTRLASMMPIFVGGGSGGGVAGLSPQSPPQTTTSSTTHQQHGAVSSYSSLQIDAGNQLSSSSSSSSSNAMVSLSASSGSGRVAYAIGRTTATNGLNSRVNSNSHDNHHHASRGDHQRRRSSGITLAIGDIGLEIELVPINTKSNRSNTNSTFGNNNNYINRSRSSSSSITHSSADTIHAFSEGLPGSLVLMASSRRTSMASVTAHSSGSDDNNNSSSKSIEHNQTNSRQGRRGNEINSLQNRFRSSSRNAANRSRGRNVEDASNIENNSISNNASIVLHRDSIIMQRSNASSSNNDNNAQAIVTASGPDAAVLTSNTSETGNTFNNNNNRTGENDNNYDSESEDGDIKLESLLPIQSASSRLCGPGELRTGIILQQRAILLSLIGLLHALSHVCLAFSLPTGDDPRGGIHAADYAAVAWALLCVYGFSSLFACAGVMFVFYRAPSKYPNDVEVSEFLTQLSQPMTREASTVLLLFTFLHPMCIQLGQLFPVTLPSRLWKKVVAIATVWSAISASSQLLLVSLVLVWVSKPVSRWGTLFLSCVVLSVLLLAIMISRLALKLNTRLLQRIVFRRDEIASSSSNSASKMMSEEDSSGSNSTTPNSINSGAGVGPIPISGGGPLATARGLFASTFGLSPIRQLPPVNGTNSNRSSISTSSSNSKGLHTGSGTKTSSSSSSSSSLSSTVSTSMTPTSGHMIAHVLNNPLSFLMNNNNSNHSINGNNNNNNDNNDDNYHSNSIRGGGVVGRAERVNMISSNKNNSNYIDSRNHQRQQQQQQHLRSGIAPAAAAASSAADITSSSSASTAAVQTTFLSDGNNTLLGPLGTGDIAVTSSSSVLHTDDYALDGDDRYSSHSRNVRNSYASSTTHRTTSRNINNAVSKNYNTTTRATGRRNKMLSQARRTVTSGSDDANSIDSSRTRPASSSGRPIHVQNSTSSSRIFTADTAGEDDKNYDTYRRTQDEFCTEASQEDEEGDNQDNDDNNSDGAFGGEIEEGSGFDDDASADDQSIFERTTAGSNTFYSSSIVDHQEHHHHQQQQQQQQRQTPRNFSYNNTPSASSRHGRPPLAASPPPHHHSSVAAVLQRSSRHASSPSAAADALSRSL